MYYQIFQIPPVSKNLQVLILSLPQYSRILVANKKENSSLSFSNKDRQIFLQSKSKNSFRRFSNLINKSSFFSLFLIPYRKIFLKKKNNIHHRKQVSVILKGILIHRVDIIQICDDEKQNGAFTAHRSILLSRVVNFFLSLFCDFLFLSDFSGFGLACRDDVDGSLVG